MNMIAFLIIIVTGIVSYIGFNDPRFRQRYKFNVRRVLVNKDYKRLVTSGFIHSGWLHLTLNMVSLLFFSAPLIQHVGVVKFLVIYFGSMIGGKMMALLIHRNHMDYSSLGASGAVNGVVFASVALFPSMTIGFFLLPIGIPNWLYGLIFVGISIYGIRSKRDNVGHEAHLGGALTGMLIALMIEPEVIMRNYIPILVVMLPTLGFLYFIVTRPHFLLLDNYRGANRHFYSIDHKYNIDKAQQEKDIDRILEKINQKGIKSLTSKEKALLQHYSKTIQ